MKIAIALAAALAIIGLIYTTSIPQQDQFEAYKLQFNKHYSKSENTYRKSIFLKNVEDIERHNALSDKLYKKGINQFTDITDEEFKSTYMGELTRASNRLIANEITVGDVDWRTKGGVTSIKNQGSCGSCWAFAATAAHESYQILTRGEPITIALSAQQLVDCSYVSPYENQGCNGGYGMHALEYIKDWGQTTEANYPYKAVTMNCTRPRGEYTMTGVVEVTGCANMENSLTTRPLAVRVDASNWKSYSSGVLTDCQQNLNHAVLLVASTSTYWVIKNSWGPSWGEQGFIRLLKGNTCGVCTGPSFPF